MAQGSREDTESAINWHQDKDGGVPAMTPSEAESPQIMPEANLLRPEDLNAFLRGTHFRPYSLRLTLPPLAAVLFVSRAVA